jgi:hypothetical protein
MPRTNALLTLCAALPLAACSAKVSSAAIPASQTVAVTIDPTSVDVAEGQAMRFTASVTGTADSGVAWAVEEAGGGAIDGLGNYLAPAVAGDFHVRAASHAAPTADAVATVHVRPPGSAAAVTVTPSAATVDACGTLRLAATVSGGGDTTVTWSTVEAAGAISTAGVYTAPATAGTYHVKATNPASGASAQATVTVQDHILAISVTPSTAALGAGQAQQFTATVTTSCGTFAAQ